MIIVPFFDTVSPEGIRADIYMGSLREEAW